MTAPEIAPEIAPSPPVAPAPTPAQSRRLFRSRQDRVLGGVCGGLGRYFGIDPVLVRVAFVALALGAGSGVLLYLIAWIAIPESTGEEPAVPFRSPANGALIVGGALLILGALALFNQLLPGLDRFVWPLAVIGVGAALLLRGEPR